MSKVRPSKKNTKEFSFSEWMDGKNDLYLGNVEMQKVEPKKEDFATVSKHMKDYEKLEDKLYDTEANKGVILFNKLYKISSILFALLLIGVMLFVVSYLPATGDPDVPVNNEVSERYIESGLQETGAVNIVTGMILDYRAFDTFGESNVLFIATITVFILLRYNKKNGKEETDIVEKDEKYDEIDDVILNTIVKILVPIIIVFGIYVILNGHISPGGGFSGGAIIGAGLILYVNAFGFKEVNKFFTEKTYKWICFAALTTYCVSKAYSFFTGANHLESHIPLGTPGAILSSGLILVLNICVGMVVACTMYAFYCMFRKGDF